MRCRACNGDFRAYKRTVKDGDQEFIVEEDLCSTCRQSNYYSSNSLVMDGPLLGDPLGLIIDLGGKADKEWE